ncbi:MAG: Peroxide operon regulator [candidate division WS6 bacterium OLB20]|uniref:Peroxide operon regulator n=1 Tax=candidate division WS6 bacterium OLB20 TaxID=1617426 RepID=A0A136LXJ2_9BACT|nr:MAG: Peroxide operon regulator [candidate division WS6 bacterium OLB20]
MRNTKSRQQLLKILEKGGAFSAAKLHELLPGMDLATIYRNLNLFTQEGITREILVKKGESMFELIRDDHQHALCNNCGKLLHVSFDKQRLIDAIDIKDFEVDDLELTIRGHCT